MSNASRVLGLREWLEMQTVADGSDLPGPVAAAIPDPAAELESRRQQVFAAAEQAGYEAGQARAQAAIEAACADAAREVAAQNATLQAELQRAIARLDVVRGSVADAIAEHERALEPAAVSLAMAVVARMLGRQQADGQLVASLCSQALDEFRQRPVVVRVPAQDASALAAHLGPHDDVRVEADAFLRPGECRLETHKGLYDTGVATRLQAIVDALIAELGAAS
ncbi:FliH/SctL family protein [Lysobacter korlensis]|uniref:Flagellar assembly protein FliH n=1 Tax=Lysobacter korlensis TaxID=553636 RepID=A0ABV6RMF6_9GAMM